MSDIFNAKGNGLTLTEWYLLKYLIEHEFANKDDLINSSQIASDGCLYVMISKIRKKFNNKDLIQPIYSKGYFISPPIRLILHKKLKASETSHTTFNLKKELESVYV